MSLRGVRQGPFRGGQRGRGRSLHHDTAGLQSQRQPVEPSTVDPSDTPLAEGRNARYTVARLTRKVAAISAMDLPSLRRSMTTFWALRGECFGAAADAALRAGGLEAGAGALGQ